MHSVEWIITFSCAIACVLSLLVIAFAWHGRRIDDHPLCRNCGFDLFLLPEATVNCPECGRNFRQARATRIGHRQRRNRLFACAVLLFVLGGGVLALIGALKLKGVDTLHYQPVWMVRNAAKSTDPALADRAYTELLRRIKIGAARAADLVPLIDYALDLQADPIKLWRPSVGDFVEQAWFCNAIDQPRWARYVRQATQSSIDFRFRDQVSRSGFFAREFTIGILRAGTTRRFNATLSADVDCDYPNGASFSTTTIQLGSIYHSTMYESVANQLGPQLKDGTHLLRATFSATVSTNGDPMSRTVDIEFSLDRPWTLVPGPSAVPLDDPSKAQEIRRCVRVEFSNKYGRPMPIITVTSPPCPVAWDVQVALGPSDAGETRPLLPRVACDTGQTATVPVFLSTIRIPDDAQTVTVTLKPSRMAAEQSIQLRNYWNGPLVFKDVPISRNKSPR